MKPSISIVIPCFNHKQYIKDCFDAILNQTVKPEEVIFIDNNSMDGSFDLASKYKNNFKKIGVNFVIKKENIQGVGFARKLGFSLVTSELIGSIDVDSIISPNWIESIKKEFSGDANIGCLCGRSYFRDWSFVGNIQISSNFVIFHLFRSLFQLWGANSAFRKDIYDSFGGMDGYFKMKDKLNLKYEYDDTYLSEQFKKTKFRLKVGWGTVANVIGNSDWKRQKDQFISIIKIKEYFKKGLEFSA